MASKPKINTSTVILFVIVTAIFCIITTGYIYNYYCQKQLSQYVFTFNISESQNNVRIARELRDGEIEKVIKYLDSNTGSDAIIFTDYKKYTPKTLHQDILKTLKMIKAYREEFKIKSTETDFQRKIDKALAQVK